MGIWVTDRGGIKPGQNGHDPREVAASQVVDRKRAALHAHASQIDSSLAGKLPASQFRYAFGTEAYIRTRDTTGTSTPEDDLFTGLENPQLQLR